MDLQVLQNPLHCHAQHTPDLRQLLQGRCAASTAFAGCQQPPKRWRQRRRRRLWPQGKQEMGLSASLAQGLQLRLRPWRP